MDRIEKIDMIDANLRIGIGNNALMAWTTVFNGSNSNVDLGNHVSLQNLQYNAVTVEGWFLSTTPSGTVAPIIYKKGNGTSIQVRIGPTVISNNVYTDTIAGSTIFSGVSPSDGFWHHFAATYNHVGDRKPNIFYDGVLNIGGTPATGTELDDSAQTAYLAEKVTGGGYYRGYFGWIRISNNIRYTANFVPISRYVSPNSDGNTVRLFKMNEGIGSVISDSSSNAQNASLTNGSWARM